MNDTLLILEDEELLASELARHYRNEGWEVALAGSLAAARRQLLEQRVDPLVVLADLHLPDGSALDLLEELRDQPGIGEWIFLTAYGSVHDAVRAMRLRAVDFVEKPCDLDRLDLVLSGAARSARAQRRLHDGFDRASRLYAVSAFLGRSPAAVGVRELLERLCRLPWSSLVIEGETGTGKGLVARILHHNSPRAPEPLVEVNCAALPAALLESELFGYEQGAFTGARGRRRGLIEQAHGGTLFLDEVGELDLQLQAKLLTAIEDRRFRRLGGDREVSVDLQVVAASNRPLTELVAQKLFRSDLYHRLKVFSIELAPLRERREDLYDLVPHFVAEYSARAGRQGLEIPQPVWQALAAYDWPGNTRELRNVIERSVLLSNTEVLSSRWLHLGAPAAAPPPPAGTAATVELPLDGSLTIEQMERAILERALRRSAFNVSAAARLLGTTRETLRYRIQKHQLRSDEGQDDQGA